MSLACPEGTEFFGDKFWGNNCQQLAIEITSMCATGTPRHCKKSWRSLERGIRFQVPLQAHTKFGKYLDHSAKTLANRCLMSPVRRRAVAEFCIETVLKMCCSSIRKTLSYSVQAALLQRDQHVAMCPSAREQAMA